MEGRPLAEIIRDLMSATSDLIRSEIHLAKAEMAYNARQIGAKGKSLAAGALMLWFGANASIAFLVIALGSILGDRYWLSSLIVAGVLLIVGAVMFTRSLRSMEHLHLKPTAIDALANDTHLIKEAAHEATQPIRRAS